MKDFQRVIDLMIYEKTLPDGIFEIEEQHLAAYMDAYNAVFKHGEGRIGRTVNRRYARKLAGLHYSK